MNVVTIPMKTDEIPMTSGCRLSWGSSEWVVILPVGGLGVVEFIVLAGEARAGLQVFVAL